MAGGEGRAGGVDEPVGRTGTVDQRLEKDREQRRQALGEGESGEGEPVHTRYMWEKANIQNSSSAISSASSQSVTTRPRSWDGCDPLLVDR